MQAIKNLFGRFKKASPSANAPDEEDDLPVMGRASFDDDARTTSRPARTAHTENNDDHEILNEGLPSVNRRSGSGLNITVLGVVLVIAMIVIFSMSGNNAVQTRAERKADIANLLPPLTMPSPKPPEPLELAAPEEKVPQINPGAPIPLQPAATKPAAPAEPSWSDRKLGGGILIGGNSAATAAAPTPAPSITEKYEHQSDANPDFAKTIAGILQKPEPPVEDLNERLKPTITKAVKAELLPDRNYVIAKGTALDCALETAIDTTVPGLITCRLTRDVYSDNGHVVMLDRGSQLVGEYKGGIKDGQARVFVLWTRAKTPNGVVVALDSPGTDALGRSGIDGWVDRHYAERFGAALLTSIIKDTFVTIANLSAQRNNRGTVVSIGNTSDTSEKMGVEILKHTLNIPPTLYVNQGAHVQVMLARDLDFSSVYKLDFKP